MKKVFLEAFDYDALPCIPRTNSLLNVTTLPWKKVQFLVYQMQLSNFSMSLLPILRLCLLLEGPILGLDSYLFCWFRKFVHVNLPWARFELGILGPITIMLPPCLLSIWSLGQGSSKRFRRLTQKYVFCGYGFRASINQRVSMRNSKSCKY